MLAQWEGLCVGGKRRETCKDVIVIVTGMVAMVITQLARQLYPNCVHLCFLNHMLGLTRGNQLTQTPQSLHRTIQHLVSCLGWACTTQPRIPCWADCITCAPEAITDQLAAAMGTSKGKGMNSIIQVLLHTMQMMARVMALGAALVMVVWLVYLGTLKYTEVGRVG